MIDLIEDQLHMCEKGQAGGMMKATCMTHMDDEMHVHIWACIEGMVLLVPQNKSS